MTETTPFNPDLDNFQVVSEQIEIEVNSAQKYFENKSYHLSLRRYESALQLFEHLDPSHFERLSVLYYTIEVRRAVIFLHLENPSKVLDIIEHLRTNHQRLTEGNEFDLNHLEGMAAFLTGQFERAARLLNLLEEGFYELLRTDRSPSLLIKAGKSIKTNAHAHLYQLMIDVGITKLYNARDLFLEADALGLVTECDLLLGELALYLQEFRSASFHVSTALNLSQSLGLNSKHALASWLQARLEMFTGNLDKAQELFFRTREMYSNLNLPRYTFLVLLDLTLFLAQRSNSEQLAEIFLEADDLIRSFSDPYEAKMRLLLRRFEVQLITNTVQSDMKAKLRDMVRVLRDRNSSCMLHTTILYMLIQQLQENDHILADELVTELTSYWESLSREMYPFAPFFKARIACQAQDPNTAEDILLQALELMNDKGHEPFLALFCVELARLEWSELDHTDLAHDYFRKALDFCESDFFLYKVPFLKDVFRYFYEEPHLSYLNFLDQTHSPGLALNVVERKLFHDLRRALGCDIIQRLLPSGLSLSLQARWDELVSVSRSILRYEAGFEYANAYDFIRQPLFIESEGEVDLSTEHDRCTRIFQADENAERALLYERLTRLKTEVIAEEKRWQHIFTVPRPTDLNTSFEGNSRTAFLSYIVGPDCIFAQAHVMGEQIVSTKIALSRAQLYELVMQFRFNVTHEHNTKILGSKLWNYVLEPLVHALGDKVERLVIIPHDILWKLPFHLLSKSNRYLWDSYLVEYSPSRTHYLEAHKRGGHRQRKRFQCFTLIVPGISEQLSDLANLEQSTKSKKSLDDLDLVSESMSKKKFWQKAKNSNILIIGTRLKLYERMPSASSFELGPSELTETETVISLNDILEKKLSETDLVIFPYVSFRDDPHYPQASQSLLYHIWFNAGVPAVMYAYWSSDPVAVFLFIKYFLQFKSQMGLSQAYQKAAFCLRDSGDFVSPRDWAPLGFIGYGGPLVREAKKKFFGKTGS
ncbi:CHAT domain-containing protein [bacterium]|nr:CHAT domain-containing protein [bacterium]